MLRSRWVGPAGRSRGLPRAGSSCWAPPLPGSLLGAPGQHHPARATSTRSWTLDCCCLRCCCDGHQRPPSEIFAYDLLCGSPKLDYMYRYRLDTALQLWGSITLARLNGKCTGLDSSSLAHCMRTIPRTEAAAGILLLYLLRPLCQFWLVWIFTHCNRTWHFLTLRCRGEETDTLRNNSKGNYILSI